MLAWLVQERFLRDTSLETGVWGKAPLEKNMANPEGTKAREPYQNFDGEGLPSESTTSPPYREGLGEGGCFF